MNRRCWPLALILAAGVVTSACQSGPMPAHTPMPTVVNRGLAYGVPCKPPCWEGLTPGLSTEDEVRQRLQYLQESGHIPAFSCSQGGCTVAGVLGRSAGNVVVSWKEQIVTSIRGSIGFDFTVQELVDLIGEPTAVYFVSGGNSCSACQPVQFPDPYQAPVYLLYPELGAFFALLTPLRGCVCPDTRVTLFEYLPTMSMEELLNHMTGVGMKAFEGVQQDDLVDWHGFGPGYGRRE